MYNLTTDNLQTSFDGHLWIKTNRQKTGTETNIRLLDTAKHIIEKYQGMAEGNKLLPVPCYANCRHGIKAVAKLCGILDECEGQKCINLSNGISIDVYALPMIIALSFRLNTLGAYKTREYVMDSRALMTPLSVSFLEGRIPPSKK